MMRTPMFRMTIVLFPVLVACSGGHSQTPTAGSGAYEAIALPNVHGRIDHLAEDTTTHRVFIAALGNNSVEVVDLSARKHVASITGIEEPQGIVFLPEDRSVLVTSGGDGSCDFYSVDDFKLKRTVKLDGDADNVRYSPSMARIFIGHGNGGIAVMDARTFAVLTDIPVDGHPESLQLDEHAQRLFVNVPDDHAVRVIDLSSMKVIDRWELSDARANFPMVLDTAAHHVIVGCRSPARLLAIDYEGHQVQSLAGPSDMDDLFMNGSVLLAIGGEGLVITYTRNGQGTLQEHERLITRNGARTGFLTSTKDHLLVAAPAREGNGAALLVMNNDHPK